MAGQHRWRYAHDWRRAHPRRRVRASYLAAMMKNDIPLELRRFILANIASVPHMEALMLVRASAPQRWSAAGLAARLYVSEAAAAGVLADLGQSGLLQRNGAGGSYCYGLCAQVEQLALFHASHLLEITRLIHKKPDRPA